MPADTWPVATPAPAMLERVKGRAKERRRARRAKQVVVGACVTALLIMFAVTPTSTTTGSRLRTTPAEGGGGADDGSTDGARQSQEAEGRRPGARPGSGGGSGTAGGRPAGADTSRPGGRVTATLPSGATPLSIPTTTTTTAPPRASAGEREIAYLRGYRLWVVAADGSGAAPLTADDPARRASDPAWAPDGSRLAAVEWHSDSTGKAVGRISVVDLDGNMRPVTDKTTEHANPEWSPDGARIAYARARPRVGWSVPDFDLWVVDADGSHNRKLSGLQGSRVQWLPDGRLLSWCNDFAELCTMQLDGSDLRAVPNSSGIIDFSLSRDGRRLAFQAVESGSGWHLGTMDLDGSRRRVLLDRWGTFGIDWSPDGRTLVFSGGPDSEPPPSSCVYFTDSVQDSCPESEPYRIWRIDVDGSDRRALSEGNDYRPSWRPAR